MPIKLLVNAASTVYIGPFLDATDGVSEETAINHTTANLQISKANTTVWANGDGTSLAHSQDGWYSYAMTSTDTNTLGPLLLKVSDSAVHLPVWHEFEVVSSQYWNAMYSTVPMPVDVNRWNTSAVTTLAIAVVDSPANLSTLSINSSGHVTLSTTPANFSALSINSSGHVVLTTTPTNFSALSINSSGEVILSTLSAALTSAIGRAVWNSTVTEPSSGPFEWTGNYAQIMEWMGALSRNQIDQSSVDQILRADSTATIISSARTTGSSASFIRGEWSS